MKKFETVKTLGDGAYGSVYKVMNRSTQEVLAVKRMKKKYFSWRECIKLREVRSLKKLIHPNIIKLKEVIRENNELFFVFEFMEKNLYEMMKAQQQTRMGRFPEKTVKSIIHQCFSGLSFMHKSGFFHRDCKPENILCTEKGNGQILCKLADFGLAREIWSKPPYTDYVSTRWYRAPEVLLRDPQYNSPIDIWAMGAIMAEMYTLRPLFPGSNEPDQLFKICSVLGSPTNRSWPRGIKLACKMHFNFPNFSSTDLRALIPEASKDGLNLIRSSLAYSPDGRPTSRAAMQTPYFKNFHTTIAPTSRPVVKIPNTKHLAAMKNQPAALELSSKSTTPKLTLAPGPSKHSAATLVTVDAIPPSPLLSLGSEDSFEKSLAIGMGLKRKIYPKHPVGKKRLAVAQQVYQPNFGVLTPRNVSKRDKSNFMVFGNYTSNKPSPKQSKKKIRNRASISKPKKTEWGSRKQRRSDNHMMRREKQQISSRSTASSGRVHDFARPPHVQAPYIKRPQHNVKALRAKAPRATNHKNNDELDDICAEFTMKSPSVGISHAGLFAHKPPLSKKKMESSPHVLNTRYFNGEFSRYQQKQGKHRQNNQSYGGSKFSFTNAPSKEKKHRSRFSAAGARLL